MIGDEDREWLTVIEAAKRMASTPELVADMARKGDLRSRHTFGVVEVEPAVVSFHGPRGYRTELSAARQSRPRERNTHRRA